MLLSLIQTPFSIIGHSFTCKVVFLQKQLDSLVRESRVWHKLFWQGKIMVQENAMHLFIANKAPVLGADTAILLICVHFDWQVCIF